MITFEGYERTNIDRNISCHSNLPVVLWGNTSRLPAKLLAPPTLLVHLSVLTRQTLEP
jgi:hypothetical protein